MRTLMSLSAFAIGIGSVSVSQTALAVFAIDCNIYIKFSLAEKLAQKGDLQAVNLLANVHALPPVEANIVSEFCPKVVDFY